MDDQLASSVPGAFRSAGPKKPRRRRLAAAAAALVWFAAGLTDDLCGHDRR